MKEQSRLSQSLPRTGQSLSSSHSGLFFQEQSLPSGQVLLTEQEQSSSGQMFREESLTTGQVLLTEQDELEQDESLPSCSFHEQHSVLSGHLNSSEDFDDQEEFEPLDSGYGLPFLTDSSPSLLSRSAHWNPTPSACSTSTTKTFPLESLSDDFERDFEQDSDYHTSNSLGDRDNLISQWYLPASPGAHYSGDASCSGSETPDPHMKRQSASYSTSISRSVSPAPPTRIPPIPFSTPPKLQSVEQVMNNYSGTDVASLRNLATALAREAIFGRDQLAKKSLSGRKHTEMLDKQKVDYIKTLVRSRVANTKSAVEFEFIWKMCRSSLSKSCQTLRNSAKKRSC